MFEQTLLPANESARKPYSMGLSLLIQTVLLGALCLAPIVCTQVLPTFEVKSVLAAPPKPPAVLRSATVTRADTTATRVFRLSNLSFQVRRAPVNAAASIMNAPPTVEFGSGDPNGVAFGIPEPVTQPPPPPPAKVAKSGVPRILKLGGNVAAANVVHMVQPMYPPLARESRIQGSVEFTATINKEGAIQDLNLVRGHPLLINAAKAAVLQWRYRPTLLNGEPVEVVTDIVVNFTLN